MNILFILEIITGVEALEEQEDPQYNLTNILFDIIVGYGGKNLTKCDTTLNALQLMASVFRDISARDLPDDIIIRLWHCVLYALDSALYTYSPEHAPKKCPFPPYINYPDELIRKEEELDENQQALQENTVDIIIYLFSFFFESPAVVSELTQPHVLCTVHRLFEVYENNAGILGKFFYNYGRAVNNTADLHCTS